MKWIWNLICAIGVALVFAAGSDGGSVRAAGPVSSTVTTIDAVASFAERQYQWYDDVDLLTPLVLMAAENTATTTPDIGSVVRLRTNIRADILPLFSGATFLLQYANATSGPWTDISTSTPWAFFDNPGVADGQIIVTTVLSASDVGESYGESNPSAESPNALLAGQTGEWDWSLLNFSATTSDSWHFRMIFSSGTVFDAYETSPHFIAAVVPTSSTPTSTVSTSTVGGGGGGVYLPPATTIRPTGTSPIEIIVGPLPPTPCDNPVVVRVDLNGDCRVDMIDLSILAYYFDRSGPEIKRYDFSGNNLVDLFDVSVMMFYWTD